jgi:hypothetical protein
MAPIPLDRSIAARRPYPHDSRKSHVIYALDLLTRFETEVYRAL